MYFEVFLEISRLHKAFATDITEVSPFPCMKHHVSLSLLTVYKPLPTYVTQVRFFTCVGAEVSIQVSLALRDAFSTNLTRPWCLSRVNSHVGLKVNQLPK